MFFFIPPENPTKNRQIETMVLNDNSFCLIVHLIIEFKQHGAYNQVEDFVGMMIFRKYINNHAKRLSESIDW